MKFHEFFQERREKLGLSLTDVVTLLARHNMGISKSAVSAWNTGDRQPRLIDKTVRTAIAAVLQIDVNEMMKIIDVAITDEDRSPEALYIADIVDSLPEDGKEEVIEYVQMVQRRYLKKTAATM